MVSPGATNAAMTGIQYKQDEIDLLKRHCDENDNITSFLPEVIDE